MPLTTCQIHIKVLLAASFLLCLLLLSSPVLSGPVHSRRFATLRCPLPTTRATCNASAPTDTPKPPPNAPLPSNVGDATIGINGMSIFWVIVPLSLACMTHPIGSSCGLEEAYHHRIRIGPFMSLFDTLHLLYEIYQEYRNTGDGESVICRIRNAIRRAVEMRLDHHRERERGNDSNPQGDPQTATLLCRIEKCFYNTPIRHLVSAVLMLQYLKLWGFHGIPMSFSLATAYFASWIMMEIVLLVGEGRAVMDPGRAALPTTNSSLRPIIPKLVGRVVFFFQSLPVLFGVSMLLWKAQSDFKFVPTNGETVPIFDIRFAIFLIISVSRMYWVDSMPLFVGISLMSGLYVSGHKNSRKVSDFIGLLMATAYIFIITTVFYTSWIWGVGHLPFVSCVAFFCASRLFWPGRERMERREGCRIMARLEPVMIFGSSALTYAGGLFFFYIFVFDPEGTWKAAWTENLP